MVSILRKKFFSAVTILAVLLLPGATSAGILPEGFFDSEKSEENTISTGTLDFSLESPADFSGAVSETQSAKRDIEMKSEGSPGFKYQLKTDNFPGDLCDKLNLKVKLDGGSDIYDGDLKSFSLKAGFFSAPEVWEFEVSLKDSASEWEDKECDFDFVYEGWQEDFANFGDGGFSDTEIIGNKIKTESSVDAGDAVINEIMWMGSADNGSPADDGSKDQWIELKNVSGRDLHLKGLYLTFKNENTGNENKLAEIGNNRIVKDGEYFLLSHYNKSNSAIKEERDDNMENFDINKFQIKLYSDSSKSVLIDAAGSGDKEPTEGDKSNFYSLERKSTPGDGTNYSNWKTCTDISSSTYWDTGRTELGTPGHDNL